MDINDEIELFPKSFIQHLRRPSTISADIENTVQCKSSTTPSLIEFLEDLKSSPNYDNNLFQFWLYKTITEWANSIGDTNLFDIDEHNVIILWLNKIFLILKENQFDCYEKFFDYLLLDTKNLYNSYLFYGWDCLIPEILNDDESKEINEEEKISISTNNTSTEYNLSDVNYEMFLKKLDVLFLLTREYFGSDFCFETIKAAVQTKYYYTIIEAPHHYYFPKVCLPSAKPEKGKKDPAALEIAEAFRAEQAKSQDFILPLSLSTDINEAFWEELGKDPEEKPKS